MESFLKPFKNWIGRIFGSSSDKELDYLRQQVILIHKEEELLKKKDDQGLRNEAIALKNIIKEENASFQANIEDIRLRAQSTDDLLEKSRNYHQIDQLNLKATDNQEIILNKILPRAFALVRETSRRLSNNDSLSLDASKYDREIAAKSPYVTIKDGNAIWSNCWEAGGQKITWKMIHYDVQLMGGIALHQGKIAEMKTGEGKTLAATLPIFLNALAGKGVHIVTVNPYLAQRDAEWMGPLLEFLTVSVDCIDKYPPSSIKRQQAYLADITYGTNNGFGFDYLRDNMVKNSSRRVHRGQHYALIDEVDSILIDDVRTPLIISGAVENSDLQEYFTLQPLLHKLYKVQSKLVEGFLNEVNIKTETEDKDKKERGLALFRAYRGAPKSKQLISLLSEKGMKQLLSETEDLYLENNSILMPEADKELYYTIESRSRVITLTEKGIQFLSKEKNDPTFFLLPDLSIDLDKIERDSEEKNKIEKKDKLLYNYKVKSARIHATNQLLKAYALFEKGIEYVVIDRQVKLVDEKTGRILKGRRYSDGLHQALEAKEHVKIQEPTQTYATITTQNQFRRYYKLSGMTGTAHSSSKEFWEIYKLPVMVIPTHRPVIRDDMDDKLFRTKEEKMSFIKKEVEKLIDSGRPVLINTPTVEASEEMRRTLGLGNKQVLNAKNHSIESQIISKAGEAGRVTITTQMGGRGTDIKLSKEALEAGGGHAIISEKNDSESIDNQVRGRFGRQGDPGSSQVICSLEDDLLKHFRYGMVGKLMDRAFMEEGEAIEDPEVTKLIRKVQKNKEMEHFASRKNSLDYDDVMDMQRVVIYKKRNHALDGQRLSLDILNIIYKTVSSLIEDAKNQQNFQSLELEIREKFNISSSITEQMLREEKEKILTDLLYREAQTKYRERRNELEKNLTTLSEASISELPTTGEVTLPIIHKEVEVSAVLDFSLLSQRKIQLATDRIECSIILHFIDKFWRQHLLDMDRLRDAVRNSVYEQKSPIMTYKFESLDLFKLLINRIDSSVVSFIFNWKPTLVDNQTIKSNQQHLSSNSPIIPHKMGTNEDISTVQNSAKKTVARNLRITVKYQDGTIKEDVKYKKVEADILKGLCEIVD